MVPPPPGGDPKDAAKKERDAAVRRPPRLPPGSDLAGVDLSQDGEVDPAPSQSALRRSTLVPEEDNDQPVVDPGSTGVFTKAELAAAAINAARFASTPPALERQQAPPVRASTPAPPAFESLSESWKKAPDEMRKAGQTIRRGILEPLIEELCELLDEFWTAIQERRRQKFPELVETDRFTALAEELDVPSINGESGNIDEARQILDETRVLKQASTLGPEEILIRRLRHTTYTVIAVSIAIPVIAFGLAVWYRQSVSVHHLDTTPPSAAGATP